MGDLIVRRATPEDAAGLALLIDGFANGHPAEHPARSINKMREAFFGDQPVGHVLLAEKNGTPLGFGAWRKTYDVFWSLYGGVGLGLHVAPPNRRLGVALCIVSAICAEIRNQGGCFLEASYEPRLAGLYERIGVGRVERACHVSAMAFETLAAASGKPARVIVRALPDKTLNHVPLNPGI